RNTHQFGGLAVWHPICLSSPEDMLKAYADPEVRRKLHDGAVEFKSGPAIGLCSTWWDYMVVQNTVLPKNKWLEGKTIGQIAKEQKKGIIDAFLRSEEHTSELQSRGQLVCRLLLEKKK